MIFLQILRTVVCKNIIANVGVDISSVINWCCEQMNVKILFQSFLQKFYLSKITAYIQYVVNVWDVIKVLDFRFYGLFISIIKFEYFNFTDHVLLVKLQNVLPALKFLDI